MGHSRERRSRRRSIALPNPRAPATCPRGDRAELLEALIREPTMSAMPPGGGEGSKDARTEQHHPPATARRDEGSPARPTPSPPAVASAGSKKRKEEGPPSAASLREIPIAKILSRLPYWSLCRFKCVSKPWQALCSARQNVLKRAPQTLAGFFHNPLGGDLRFNNLSGEGTPLVDPSLPFLRKAYRSIQLEHCSSSLLLCSCRGLEDLEGEECEYVVCNPITGQWTVLPPIVWLQNDRCSAECFTMAEPVLGFDPAVPSGFVVFAPLVESVDVAIYSSETGRWTRSSGWEDRDHPAVTAQCVFMNGMMHFMHLLIDEPVIAIVNAEGVVYKEIPLPEEVEGGGAGYGSVGCSQGRLHAWYMDHYHYQLSVWVLEDYRTEAWTRKHTVDVPELFRFFSMVSGEVQNDEEDCAEEDETCKYEMFAIHPRRNLIFLTDLKKVNLSYDMDREQVHLMRSSGDFLAGGLPYIPCFADLALGLDHH